jgi:hypothetical protein
MVGKVKKKVVTNRKKSEIVISKRNEINFKIYIFANG